MNAKQLAEIIGNIDEKYIMEAEAAASAVPKSFRRRRIMVIAAVLCMALAMTATAFAANWFGLRDLLLPEDEGSQGNNTISLIGYQGSAEFQAAAEWQAFLGSYDVYGVAQEMGNAVFAPGTSYNFYQVYNQEMADKLDEITAKYNLKLHTFMFDNLYPQEKLCAQVGGDFLGSNNAFSAYMYEDGTFKFDGDIVLDGYGELWYQFIRSVKGSFTDVVLNVGDAEQYTEWAYTTENGIDLSLVLGPYRALVIADLGDSFVTIIALNGYEKTSGDIFGEGGLTEETLEAFAETFDFSVLTPVKTPQTE